MWNHLAKLLLGFWSQIPLVKLNSRSLQAYFHWRRCCHLVSSRKFILKINELQLLSYFARATVITRLFTVFVFCTWVVILNLRLLVTTICSCYLYHLTLKWLHQKLFYMKTTAFTLKNRDLKWLFSLATCLATFSM